MAALTLSASSYTRAPDAHDFIRRCTVIGTVEPLSAGCGAAGALWARCPGPRTREVRIQAPDHRGGQSSAALVTKGRFSAIWESGRRATLARTRARARVGRVAIT